MKKLFVILLLFPVYSFSQQMLWSTIPDHAQRLVTKEEASEEVLNLLNQYDYFFDGSGYNKSQFLVFLEKSSVFNKGMDKQNIKEIIQSSDSPTVFAFKYNTGDGSEVQFFYIDKNTMDMGVFTNEYFSIPNRNHTSNKKKFQQLFRNLFQNRNNPKQNSSSSSSASSGALYKGKKNNITGSRDDTGNSLARNYNEGESGFGNMMLDLKDRRWVSPPRVEDKGEETGRVVVKFRVNRQGTITWAKAGMRGTTISDESLWAKCERALMNARFNPIETAPESQTGQVVFNFGLR